MTCGEIIGLAKFEVLGETVRGLRRNKVGFWEGNEVKGLKGGFRYVWRDVVTNIFFVSIFSFRGESDNQGRKQFSTLLMFLCMFLVRWCNRY